MSLACTVHTVMFLCFRVFPDVHGVHSHGPEGEKTESDPGGEGARERERHCQLQLSERSRQKKEREKVLLISWRTLTFRH